MQDEPGGSGWRLDPETRAAMRLDRVRKAMASQDWVEAILEIEELLDEEPNNVDGLFLLGESLLEVGDARLALEAYHQFVQITGGDARSLLGLAIARFDTCDILGAVEAARECVRLEPAVAEGHWYLGLALERLDGHQDEAARCLAVARELEPDAYPFPLTLADADWTRAVAEALVRQHPDIARFWDGVTMVFDDLPRLELLRAQDPPAPPTVSGIYDGTPPKDEDPAQVRPEAMRLFKRNLARARSRDELVELIALALQTEALDWLGLVDVSELDG